MTSTSIDLHPAESANAQVNPGSALSSPASSESPSKTPKISKTTMMDQLQDPDRTMYNLLYDMRKISYESPLMIQIHDDITYTLLISDQVFGYSQLQDGKMDLFSDEENEQTSGEASDAYSLMDPPYFRIYREKEGFFAVPKTQHQNMQTTAWVGEDNAAADVFLALGWLVKHIKDRGRRVTRYVCALNLSTDPVSMWLIYDYRQPDFCYNDYMFTAAIPTFPDENY